MPRNEKCATVYPHLAPGQAGGCHLTVQVYHLMTTGRWPMSLERAVMLLTLATDAVLAGDVAVIDDDIKPELRAAIRCTTKWLRMESQDGQQLPYNKATEGR